MKIREVDGPPQKVDYYEAWSGPGHEDIQDRMTSQHVEDVVEIFKTPLIGHYNWDYSSADGRIRKLYRLGKELNWNADFDVDWAQPIDHALSPFADDANPLQGWGPYDALPEDEKIRLDWNSYAWRLSQFVHGEQGALLVASQLASCAPTYDAKLYAASQTFDEARHVEVFHRYLTEKVGMSYPVNNNLKSLIDKILGDERWDLKFIGMQIIIEGLALSAFRSLQSAARDPLIRQIIELVNRDEARHVTFGVNYLQNFLDTLSDEEVEDRAQFAYEACVVMRDRLFGSEFYQSFDLDPEEAKHYSLNSAMSDKFRAMLFKRVVPNLKRIGLITERVKPKYDDLGVLEFEDAVDDGEIDWVDMSRPLPVYT